jgi:sugar lactone lactonase YvrE
MQISPDGQYLAVTNRLMPQVIFGFGLINPHQIRLYRIDASNGSLSLVGIRPLTVGVSGLDFSPDGQFLYFIRTTVLGNTAMRMEVPAGLIMPQVLLVDLIPLRSSR